MPTTAADPTSSAADANRQFVNLVREVFDGVDALSPKIDTLSRMRPEFAPFARNAKQILASSKNVLRDGMVKSVAGQPEIAGQGRQPSPQ